MTDLDSATAATAVSGHQNVISYNQEIGSSGQEIAVSGHQNVISYNDIISDMEHYKLCLDIKT